MAEKYWKCMILRIANACQLRSDCHDVKKKFTGLNSIINIT